MSLFDTVERYSDLGDHRTGTSVDEATVEWLEGELEKLGAQSERLPFEFDRFDARWEVRADGEVVDAIPLFYEATGEVRTDRPLVTSRPVVAGNFIDGFDAVVSDAHAAGATAAVVATETPLGTLCAVNRRPVSGSGLPTLCVAGRDAERLRTSRVDVSFEARIVEGSSVNVRATIGEAPDEKRVLLATPLSGWFRCAGERGTGVAVLLATAKTLAERGIPLTILATNGHELDGLGLDIHLRTTRPAEKAIFHFGASVASGDSDGVGPPSRRTRMLLPSAWAGESRRASLERALAPLGVTVRLPSDDEAAQPSGWIGESARWAPLGRPLVSIAGGFPLHHAPEDVPTLATTPELLRESYEVALNAAEVLASV